MVESVDVYQQALYDKYRTHVFLLLLISSVKLAKIGKKASPQTKNPPRRTLAAGGPLYLTSLISFSHSVMPSVFRSTAPKPFR